MVPPTKHSSETDSNGREIGRRRERLEDPRFLTGRATYTADLSRPGSLHAAVLRSQYPHAEIGAVDVTAASAHADVEAVITRRDLVESPRPTPSNLPVYPAIDVPKPLRRRVLPDRRTRYQGEPLALVVATDAAGAHDALESISVEYDRLDAVVDPDAALADDTPQLHEAAPDNVGFTWETGDAAAVDETFSRAEKVVTLESDAQRIAPNPVEPRATLAEFEPSTEKLTVRLPSQCPGYFRRRLSTILDHPEHRIRVVVPDVGGGFGTKMILYPAEVLVAWAAIHLGRPVAWQATRTESYLADAHGRGAGVQGELAVAADGEVLGIRTRNVADLGAYVSERNGRLQTGSLASKLSNQYDVRAIHHKTTGVLTNKAPVDAYRGTTTPRVTLAIEHLLDRAARRLDMDPAEIRRRNQIGPDQFPYETVPGIVYDTGRYEAALDATLEEVGYGALRDEQVAARSAGRYLGVGLSCFVEPTGLGPSEAVAEPHWEASLVTCHPSGTVTAHVGTMDMGTGHETVYAQVISETLGVPIEDIQVMEGDTDQLSEGTGSFASRSAVLGSAAIENGLRQVLEKARRIAAHRFEVDEADLEFADGTFHVSGAPDRSVTIQEVAETAYAGTDLPDGMDPGLSARATFDPDGVPTSYGTHVAVVEVDIDTGDVEILRYVAVDDCGRQLNPTIVQGQLHGGIAQGIGEALLEEARYGENGTLMTGSHQDYALPRAEGLPEIETVSLETPTPHNALGVKGVGEAGTIAAPAAVVNAVHDALEPFDVPFIQPPLTPEKVWRAIESAR